MSEYSGFDVKQLWHMVDAARSGLQPSHDQALALSKAQQMLSGHAEALETAQEQLAAKWPPTSNAASAAYLAELDRLITAVKETALSCAVNVFHINLVSDAIVQAHQTMKPLHTEFEANESALARFDKELDAAANGGALIPGGRVIAKRVAKLFAAPPIADGRQDQLTLQARHAMEQLSEAAQDGALYIKSPTPYVPPTVKSTYGGDDLIEIDDPGRRHTPPVIDPPQISNTTPLGSHALDSRTKGAQGGVLERGPSNAGQGPILSSVKPAPGPSSPSPIGTGPLTDDPSGIHKIGTMPGALPGMGISHRNRVAGPTQGASIIGIANPDDDPRSQLGTLPGGVIGNHSPSRAFNGSPGPFKANPPGGLIDAHLEARRAPQPAGSASGDVGRQLPMGIQPGLHGSRTSSERKRWDPDNPWEVNEGVDPVILPSGPPKRIDPGPGIIGLNS